jgi:hypothetical protein
VGQKDDARIGVMTASFIMALAGLLAVRLACARPSYDEDEEM